MKDLSHNSTSCSKQEIVIQIEMYDLEEFELK